MAMAKISITERPIQTPLRKAMDFIIGVSGLRGWIEFAPRFLGERRCWRSCFGNEVQDERYGRLGDTARVGFID